MQKFNVMGCAAKCRGIDVIRTAVQVCFEVVGYLLEELRDAKNFEALKEDVATANIFIGSLIFIEELAEKVGSSRLPRFAQSAAPSLGCCVGGLDTGSMLLCGRCQLWPWGTHNLTPAVLPCAIVQIVEAVKPLRDNLDACLIFPSMPAVMKLNKLGTFSMSQLGQSKSMFSEFIKSARKVGTGGRTFRGSRRTVCGPFMRRACCCCCSTWVMCLRLIS